MAPVPKPPQRYSELSHNAYRIVLLHPSNLWESITEFPSRILSIKAQQ
jgi:hypothetical protein